MLPDGPIALLDIGGTTTRLALASDSQSDFLSRLWAEPTPYDYDAFIGALERARDALDCSVSAVGASFGVSLSGGVVVAASKMPDFVGRNIAKDIGGIFGCPASVHHDCVCALAALVGGIHDGQTFGYATVSTGLGAAIVSNVQGVLFFERVRLAHHVVDLHSQDRCACGRLGCLATFVDSSRFRKAGVTLESVLDPEFWNGYRLALAVGLGNMCRLFGLSRLFVGGGVVSNPNIESVLPTLVKAQLPSDGYQEPTIEVVKDGATVPLRGSLALARLPSALFREF